MSFKQTEKCTAAKQFCSAKTDAAATKNLKKLLQRETEKQDNGEQNRQK